MVPARAECSYRLKRCFVAVVLLCFCVPGFVPAGYGQTDRVSRLISELKGKNARVRHRAAEELVKIGAPAVEPLIAALKDPDSPVRVGAVGVLGNIKDPRAVEPLMAALKDPDSGARGGAAVALGKIKDPRAVEPLMAALKDMDSGVRGGAVEALGEIGPPAAEPLIAALKDPDSGVRRSAAWALGDIKDPREVSVLLAAWSEPDLAVIAAASSFFIGRGEPGSEDTLIRALNAQGDSRTVMLFLNSGNSKLEAAAREWAAANSNQPLTIVIAGGGSVHFVRWGSAR